MDLQSVLNNAVEAERNEQFKHTDQITLGELKALFGSVEVGKPVVFEDGEHVPSSFSSWRGSYGEVAIRYTTDDPHESGDFYSMVEDAIGSTFTGYKGGDFTMGQQTPVWVANYGEVEGFEDYEEYSIHQGVTGVREEDDRVVIETDGVEY